MKKELEDKKQKLLHQLSIASEILNNNQIDEKGLIIDLVKGTLDLLYNNNLLKNDEIKMLKNQLKKIVCNLTKFLTCDYESEKVKKYGNCLGLTKEDLVLEVMIMNELCSFKLDIEKYINELEEYNEYVYNDKIVNDLTSQITSKINELTKLGKSEYGKNIKSKVNSIIEEYQKQLKESKPILNLDNTKVNLLLEDNSYKSLRNKLIYSLKNILADIRNRIIDIKILEQLVNYRWYFSNCEAQIKLGKSIELSIKNNFPLENEDYEKKDSNFGIIRRICLISYYIKEADLKINDRLYILINNAYTMVKNKINNDNDIVVNCQDEFNIFQTQINDLLIESRRLEEEFYPYIKLYDNVKECKKSLDSKLKKLSIQFISVPYDLILAVLYEENKLRCEFESKYFNLIKESLLKKKNNEDVISPEEIIFDINKEIDFIVKNIQKKVPILEQLKKMFDQINMALQILDGKNIETDGKIISLIKEIKILLDNNLIYLNIKNEIIDKIKQHLKYWHKIYFNSDMNIHRMTKSYDRNVDLTLDKVIVEEKLVKELTEIKLIIEEYIKNLPKDEDLAISNIHNSLQHIKLNEEEEFDIESIIKLM